MMYSIITSWFKIGYHHLKFNDLIEPYQKCSDKAEDDRSILLNIH